MICFYVPLISHWNSIENRGPFCFVKKTATGTCRTVLQDLRSTSPVERRLGRFAETSGTSPNQTIGISPWIKAINITGDEPLEELLSYLWGFHLRLQFESRGLYISSFNQDIYHIISSYIIIYQCNLDEMSTSLKVQLKSFLGRLRSVTIFFC